MKVIKKFFRFIVGSEYGLCGEGNAWWYYTLSLAINLMLIWSNNPKLTVPFAILMIIHLIIAAAYGIFDLSLEPKLYSYIYLAIHVILVIIACIINWKWAIITAIITCLACAIAPDCCGESHIINNTVYIDGRLPVNPLVFNTIIFAAFIITCISMPTRTWIKILLIIIEIIIHPLMDLFEGSCFNPVENFFDAIDKLDE